MSDAIPPKTAVWLLVASLFLATHAPAQYGEEGARLEYRRVFIPRDRLAEFAAGHIAIKRAKFEELLAAMETSPAGRRVANVRLVEAEFSARLEQAELVAGEAQLQIEQQTTEPAILELEPCTLAISSPRGPDESAPPARLGVDAGGKLAVVVEPRAEQAHSVLGFRWSLRGARDPAGALIFDLKTPLCPTTRLKLDLPADHIPLSAQALITRLEPTAEQQTAQRVTWLLEYAGGVPGSLSIVPTAALAQSPQFVLLKQTAVHEATPQCLESSFDLDLDVYRVPLRQLTDGAATWCASRRRARRRERPYRWSLRRSGGRPASSTPAGRRSCRTGSPSPGGR
jgi:hypothetical protein